MRYSLRRTGLRISAVAFLFVFCMAVAGMAQRRHEAPKPTGPWMNTALSPDERADLVLKEMTLDEKIALLHGVGMPTEIR